MSVFYWLNRRYTPKKQRTVFIVRAVDNLKLDQDTSEIVNDPEYITKRLESEMPPGRVFLVNMSEEDDQLTLTSIREKLAAHHLTTWRAETLPSTVRTKFQQWIKMLLDEISDEPDGAVVLVVSRSSFEIWSSQVKWSDSRDQRGCVLKTDNPSTITCVA